MKLITGCITIFVAAAITAPQYVMAQDEEIEEIVVLGLKERFGSGLSRTEFVIGKEDLELRPGGADDPESHDAVSRHCRVGPVRDGARGVWRLRDGARGVW